MAKGQENDPRQEAIARTIAELDKKMGRGTVMLMGERPRANIPAIPTGSFSLDMAIGIGGVPKGRIIEIFGMESGGKTTLCLSIVGQAQTAGEVCAYVDAEHALDPDWAKTLGVNIDKLYISQPDTGEDCLEVVEALCRSGAIGLIVVDSVAALVPKAEIEGDMGDSSMGVQARLMSQALRKLGGVVHQTNTCVIFINQIREKIGVVFGNPEVTPGGRALKFWSSVRIDVRKVETLKKDTKPVGIKIRARIIKNKVGPPFKVAEFELIFGEGINLAADIFDAASELNLIEKSGNTYTYEGDTLGVGRDKAIQGLKDNSIAMSELREACKRGNKDRQSPASDKDDDLF